MKQKQWLSVLVALFLSTASFAQTFPTPEFTARPYSLLADMTLRELERAEAKVDLKLKGGGYGGSEMYYTVFSEQSTVRYPKASLPRLVIKVDGGEDPADFVTLSVGSAKKGKRSFLQSSSSMYGKARDVSGSFVKLEFRKIQDGLYEIILPASIAPSEYAFMPIADGKATSTGIKISCFGIDQ